MQIGNLYLHACSCLTKCHDGLTVCVMTNETAAVTVFAMEQEVIVSNPRGKGAQHFTGLRARVIGVAPRTIGRPGEAVYHVAFTEARFPINDNYFDWEELTEAPKAVVVQSVREFSPCGPCLPRGPLVDETAQFYVYVNDRGARKRIAKKTDTRYSRAHIEPCARCMDHPRTSYPNGYMD